ncbi:hypothetical protein [Streptomyces aureocirculatus]|uniref:hypothetical protein n=1 Tax=Streptomyces aureocirculatus TaxID=67275 RepID=UPI0005684C1F|nr:hypothetical protein [Streptomyces aureocirculatus]
MDQQPPEPADAENTESTARTRDNTESSASARDAGSNARPRDAESSTGTRDTESSARARGTGSAVCSRCGAVADGWPPTWTCSVENGVRHYFCDVCARDNIRSIEGRLDSSWW